MDAGSIARREDDVAQPYGILYFAVEGDASNYELYLRGWRATVTSTGNIPAVLTCMREEPDLDIILDVRPHEDEDQDAYTKPWSSNMRVLFDLFSRQDGGQTHVFVKVATEGYQTPFEEQHSLHIQRKGGLVWIHEDLKWRSDLGEDVQEQLRNLLEPNITRFHRFYEYGYT